MGNENFLLYEDYKMKLISDTKATKGVGQPSPQR